MGVETGGQSKHSDDVYTDAGQFCVGGESGGEVGEWWVECLGGLCGYGVFAGEFVGDGDLV